MGFSLSRLFSSGVGSFVEKVGAVADEFNLSGEEKQNFKLKMEALLQQRDSELEQSLRAEMQAKERVLVAELTQGDTFTKRARPTVVYAGLAYIGINYVLFPIATSLSGADVKPLPDLPTEFWYGWSGIVGTWSLGRSAEKIGINNKITRAVTGSSPRAQSAQNEAVG
ncbi:MAG: hypothetical protein GXP10_00840 [Gammaproteobacteria bacterium]|nr:hypothetical protein [Gammaproteobacteria bacterium]